jgi:signal transduction histidine kinase
VQSATRSRQRSIRSTIVYLLVLPIVAMIVLYAYAVYGSIGPARAKQNASAVNNDIGAPFAGAVQAIEAEQIDSFAWQASFHHDPQANMQKDYATTDKAVAGFLAGDAKAQGAYSPQSREEDPKLRAALGGLQSVRATAATAEGPAGGLATFKSYLNIQHVITEYSTGLANPNASIAENEESQVIIEAGTGTEDMYDVATLLTGVVAGGGVMTPDEYQEFQSLYYEQQVNFGLVNNLLYWQVSPDPYYTSVNGQPPAMSTPQVKAMLNLEEQVLKAGSFAHAVKLSITPATLQQAIVGALVPPSSPLIIASTASRDAITAKDNSQGNFIYLRLAIVGGVGFLAVLLSAFLLWRFGRRITRELTGLRGAAQTLAGERLPSVVRRLRAGDDVDVDAEAPPLELGTKTREVTETADSFSAVQRTAVEAAVEQALLRKGVSNVFRSLARRNQSLLQRQLKMLDEMERGTQDPDALSQLFRLDHLTTRMRRQAEGLIILSGAAPGRRWRQPVAIVEVLRGAISEIEDYVRVDLVTDSPDFLTGAAVADVTHLLAELIENAVVYSPPATRVQVRGGRVANGYVIEVEDRGLGIPPAARDQLNERLAQPPEFDLADSDQLGLFVVSRLAIRNGIRVSLRESGYGGTTAIVLLPGTLAVSEEEARVLAAQGAKGAIGAGGRPTDSGANAVPTASRRTPRFDRPANAADDPQESAGGDPFRDDAYASGPAGSGSFGTGSYTSGPFATGSYGNGSSGNEAAGNGSSYGARSSYGGGPSGGGESFGDDQSAGGFFGSRSSGAGSSLPTRGAGDSLPTRGAGDSLPTRGGGSGLPTRGGGDSAPTRGGGSSLPTRGGGGRGAFGSPAPFQDAPAPASPFAAAGDGGGHSDGTGPAGLPRRQKMASLAPQLRENRPEASNGPVVGRSPEQARALLSSIQRGLRTGRDSNLGGEPGTGGQDPAGDGDDGRNA